jgi:hypothetical protein
MTGMARTSERLVTRLSIDRLVGRDKRSAVAPM